MSEQHFINRLWLDDLIHQWTILMNKNKKEEPVAAEFVQLCIQDLRKVIHLGTTVISLKGYPDGK